MKDKGNVCFRKCTLSAVMTMGWKGQKMVMDGKERFFKKSGDRICGLGN